MRDVHRDVEAFAVLLAELDAPFGDRANVLARYGLDEETHEALVTAWRDRLCRSVGEDQPLGKRFAAAYAHATSTLRPRGGGASVMAGSGLEPRFLSASAQPWRPEAAGVLLSAEPQQRDLAPAPRPAGTPDSGCAHPLRTSAPPVVTPPPPSMVSQPPPPSMVSPPPPVVTPPPPVVSPLPGLMHGIAPPMPPEIHPEAPPLRQYTPTVTTQSMPVFSGPPPGPVLPFRPLSVPVEAAPPPPGKRLIRFDPQTGQPLPAPIWVDIPVDPKQGR